MLTDSNFEKGSEGNMDYLRVGTKEGLYVGVKPLMRQGTMHGPAGIGPMGKALVMGFRVRVSGSKGAGNATEEFPTLAERFMRKNHKRCSFMMLHTINTTNSLPDKAEIDAVFSQEIPKFLDEILNECEKDGLSFEQRKNQVLQYILSKLQPSFDKMYEGIPSQFMASPAEEPHLNESQQEAAKNFESLMQQTPLGSKTPPLTGHGSDSSDKPE